MRHTLATEGTLLPGESTKCDARGMHKGIEIEIDRNAWRGGENMSLSSRKFICQGCWV